MESPNIPTFNGSNKSSKPSKFPRIQVLVAEIISDSLTEKLPSYGIPQKKISPGIVAEEFQPTEEVFPKRSPDTSVFQEKEQPEEIVQESSPRTEGNIIGFSDEISDSDESVDITYIKSNVKFLPATVEGLRKRFHELFSEFMRQKKHEYRSQLVRQEGINRDEYTQLNNVLAEYLLELEMKKERSRRTMRNHLKRKKNPLKKTRREMKTSHAAKG